MRKPVFFFLFFALAFTFLCLRANNVQAAESAIVGVPLSNSLSTPVQVTVNYFNGDGWFDSDTITVTNTNSPVWVYSDLDTPDQGNVYKIDWGYTCNDPQASATYKGTWGDPIGPSVAAYEAPLQDVSPLNPCVEPDITVTTCAGFDWRTIPVGAAPNVDHFNVWLDDNSGSSAPTVVGGAVRTISFASSPGSHAVRINAIAPTYTAPAGSYYGDQSVGGKSRGGGWSSPSYGSYVCGGTATPATNLSQSTSCSTAGSGAIVNVAFSWTRATGTTFTDQYLDFSVFNNNFASSSQNVNVGVPASSYNGTGFQTGTAYYWRINTKDNAGVWWPSTTAQFTTPTCPTVTSPVVQLSEGVTCADSSARIKYSYTMSDSQQTYLHVSSNSTMSGATSLAGPFTSSGSFTWDPPSNGIWYAQLNRFAYVGNKVSNSVTSDTTIDGHDCTVSPCPVGCTAPGLTYSWGRPPGYATFVDARNVTATCSGTGTSCTTGSGIFLSGSSLIYSVKVNGSNGPVLKSGGTTANSNGSASISWTMRYQVVLWDGGTIVQNNSNYTGLSISYSNLKPNTSYLLQVWAPDTAGGLRWSSQTKTTGACSCPPPPPLPPPPPPPVISLSVTSSCADGVNALVTLTWSSNTANTAYSAFRDGVNVTGSGNPASLGSTANSWTSGADTGTHNWEIRGTGGDNGAVNSNIVSHTTAVCAQAPADPSGLSASASCDINNNPIIFFSWTDNATNETGYWLDVNGVAWTGSTAPSPWGVKTLGANANSFVWYPTALDSGDVNPALAGPQLLPEKSKIYYWRLKAFNPDRQSSHVYPPDSLFPPGLSVKTAKCGFDLSVSIVNFDPSYAPNDPFNGTIRVTNNPSSTNASPVLGVSDGLGVWHTRTTDPNVNCPLNPQAPAALTNSAGFPVNALSPGASQDIPITFDVGGVAGIYQAYIVVIPVCTPEDNDWTNNGGDASYKVSITYSVGIDTWFRTTGGDVGARQNISMKKYVPPQVTSTYMLVAGAPDAQVKATTSKWKITGYSKPLFPSDNGSVYTYMATRHRTKATASQCSFNAGSQTAGDKFTFCATAADVGGAVTAVGNWVAFIDGDLNINSNFTIPPGSTITFIVAGNINVNASIMRTDGVYISGQTFKDCAGALCNVVSALTVQGAVYARNFSLSRVLSGALNDTQPADIFNFEPKYLVKLASLLGSPSINWREVAP